MRWCTDGVIKRVRENNSAGNGVEKGKPHRGKNRKTRKSEHELNALAERKRKVGGEV